MLGKKAATSNSTIHVQCAGDAAAQVVKSTPIKVIAVFEHSFYVSDSQSRIACFLPRSIEPGPLHLLCTNWHDPAQLGIEDGTVFMRRGALLHSPRCIVNAEDAALWQPEPFPRFDRALLERGYAGVMPSLSSAPDQTLASLILGENSNGGVLDSFTGALLAQTKKGIDSLLAWLTRPDAMPPADAFSLIGLGTGLTPSGDDIIAGVLLTLHAAGRRETAEALANVLSGLPMERTNRISAAHMMAAMKGSGAQVFHEVLNAMLAGESDYASLVERIAKIGHTSGWDALLGIAVTARWILQTA